MNDNGEPLGNETVFIETIIPEGENNLTNEEVPYEKQILCKEGVDILQNEQNELFENDDKENDKKNYDTKYNNKRYSYNKKKDNAKVLRNLGKDYVSTRNKSVAKRTMKIPCSISCKFECAKRVTEEQRKEIFEKYWSLGCLEKQRFFILKSMTQIKHKDNLQRRRENNNYHFYIDNNEVRVCKQFFRNTLGISVRAIRTVQEKFTGGFLQEDRRGKHNKHKRVDYAIKAEIFKHINSIPRMESHYLRAQTSRKFIEGGKSLADLHRDYVELCKSENRPYGNYTMYSRIFKDKFNISFFFSKERPVWQMCGIYKFS